MDQAPDPEGQLRRVETELAKRWPESTIDPSLERIRGLVDLLGEPQRAYPVIHLTGTNGKTSTARMVDELLRGFGLRVGRFTSPHLESVTERICIDGDPLSPAAFVAAYDEIAPYVHLVDDNAAVPMSFFEVLTGMAYAAFANAPVDVAVVEVGLGGTWDATNVADGQVAVVLPVGFDHTGYLGSTLAQIATEKAGIVKPGATVISGVQPAEAAQVLLRRAVEVGATVASEGLEFGVLGRSVAVGGQLMALQGLGGVYDELFLPVHGAHQASNAGCALAAVEAFFGAGEARAIDIEVVRESFAAVTSPGRLEAVRSSPTVLLDAAHNPAGMAASVAAVREAFDFTHVVAVVAMLADKDARGMLGVLEPLVDAVVVTENSSPRRMALDELAGLAVEVLGAERVEVSTRLDDAIEAAIRLAEEAVGDGPLSGAGVLVTGSVVTVGEARTLLRR